MTTDHDPEPHGRSAPSASREWDGLVLPVGLALFFLIALLSSVTKDPVGDSILHYTFGTWVLGEPLRDGDHLMWDGTMPVSALNVLTARSRVALTPLLGEPPDPYDTPLGSIPAVTWSFLPTVFFGMAAMGLLWWTAKRFFGNRAAATVVFVTLCEPTLLGHSRFITTDVPGAAMFLAGVAALMLYVERPGRRRAALLASALALAQLCKLPNLLLYPITAIVVLTAEACRARADHLLGRWDLRSSVRRIAGLAALALLAYVAALQ
ncbi:glycosyltransferase family 39 protein, partial [Candidatus Poribacteria bacterium]|nr:glycosyltransferase family 39 protein [Candidatus Poribacteria bacterium]